MSEHVKNMVDATINQDAAAFMDNFQQAISTKIAARLDTMYPEVAHSVMNPQAEAPEETPAPAEVEAEQ
jgi:hypothetical protein